MVPVLAGPRAPWDPGCEPGVLGRRWSAPPQDRLMKAPLIERTAVPDTFCLFYVNNFMGGSGLTRLAVVRSRPSGGGERLALISLRRCAPENPTSSPWRRDIHPTRSFA